MRRLIGHRHDLRGDGDLLTFKPVRVAHPVPASRCQQHSVGQSRQGLTHAGTASFFPQNSPEPIVVEFFTTSVFSFVACRACSGWIRECQIFAGCHARSASGKDERVSAAGQVAFVGFQYKRVQNIGGCSDMQHVHTALPLRELRQYGSVMSIIVSCFCVSSGDRRGQPLRLSKHQGVDDAAAHDGHIKRAADIAGRRPYHRHARRSWTYPAEIMTRDPSIQWYLFIMAEVLQSRPSRASYYLSKAGRCPLRTTMATACLRRFPPPEFARHPAPPLRMARFIAESSAIRFFFFTHDFTYHYKRINRAVKMCITHILIS